MNIPDKKMDDNPFDDRVDKTLLILGIYKPTDFKGGAPGIAGDASREGAAPGSPD